VCPSDGAATGAESFPVDYRVAQRGQNVEPTKLKPYRRGVPSAVHDRADGSATQAEAGFQSGANREGVERGEYEGSARGEDEQRPAVEGASEVWGGGDRVAPQCAFSSSGPATLQMHPGDEVARGGDGGSWEDGMGGKRRKVGGGGGEGEEGAWPAEGGQEYEPEAGVDEAGSAEGVGDVERDRRPATETHMARCAVFEP
jgi:hypothetical protein